MKHRMIISLIMLILIGSTANAEPVTIDGWEITKAKDGCLISTLYEPTGASKELLRAAGFMIGVKLFKDSSISINIAGNGWKLISDNTYNVEFQFSDDTQVFSADFTPFKTQETFDRLQKVNRLSEISDWYEKFKTSKSVDIKINDTYIGSFGLNNENAIKVVEDCVGGLQ